MKKRITHTDEYLMQALFLLLEEKPFTAITIKELVTKAGVNRSTYYRSFHSKEDIVCSFYIKLLKSCVSYHAGEDLATHLYNIFTKFIQHKKQLLSLHKNHLTPQLFTALHSLFVKYRICDTTSAQHKTYALYYHMGGIFHTLMLWLEQDMRPSVSFMVEESLRILPENFKPVLSQN